MKVAPPAIHAQASGFERNISDVTLLHAFAHITSAFLTLLSISNHFMGDRADYFERG
jgi:hypothetical protein